MNPTDPSIVPVPGGQHYWGNFGASTRDLVLYAWENFPETKSDTFQLMHLVWRRALEMRGFDVGRMTYDQVIATARSYRVPRPTTILQARIDIIRKAKRARSRQTPPATLEVDFGPRPFAPPPRPTAYTPPPPPPSYPPPPRPPAYPPPPPPEQWGHPGSAA